MAVNNVHERLNAYFKQVSAEFERAMAPLNTPEMRARMAAGHQLVEKVMRGAASSNAKVSAAYRALDDMTPAEAKPIIDLLPEPPKPRGRPVGTSLAEADAPLVAIIRERALAGEAPATVARELAPHAEGGSTLESKAKRLERRYREGE